jgi:hypothetical protein
MPQEQILTELDPARTGGPNVPPALIFKIRSGLRGFFPRGTSLKNQGKTENRDISNKNR